MSEFSNLLIEYFRNYNIWFLSIIVVFQCIGIPTGASLLVMACGAFAYAGEFNIGILLLQIWFFAWLGDNIAYIIWKVIGDKTLNRFPKLKRYSRPKMFKAKKYLIKHGKSTVFLSRFFISAMGPFVNAAAGITGYKFRTFSIFVALGELFWTCIYLGLGYWFGDSWETVVPMVSEYGWFSTFIASLIITFYFLNRVIRNNKVKTRRYIKKKN